MIWCQKCGIDRDRCDCMTSEETAGELAVLMATKERLLAQLAEIDKAIRDVLRQQNLPL